MKTINFLLAGVGGQGTILASDVLVNVGLRAGFQAKQAEVHGMSQREQRDQLRALGPGGLLAHRRRGRGRRVSCVREGRGAAQPGAAAARSVVVINMQAIEPITVTSGGQPYPDDDRLRATVAAVTDKAAYIDGERIAGDLGNTAANVVLLGALSALVEQEGLALRSGGRCAARRDHGACRRNMWS